MFHQILAPVAGNLFLSFLVGLIPIAVVLVLLGILRRPAWQAALSGLIVGLLIAIGVWQMPLGLAASSTLNGMVFALLPVMWIVWNAMWLYNIAVRSGKFELFRRWMVYNVPADKRILLILIGFCFGALMEGIAGFGTPVAIGRALLIALGFPALEAITLTLIFNTTPVAFGALGTPITTLGTVTGLNPLTLSAMVGRQLPFFSLLLPFYALIIFTGLRSLRTMWPAAVVAGGSFAVTQFAVSNFLGPQLPDVLASLVSLSCVVAFVQVWKPRDIEQYRAHFGGASVGTAAPPARSTSVGMVEPPARHEQDGPASTSVEADAGGGKPSARQAILARKHLRMSTHENASDVARLLRRIDEANEAACRALSGLAAGIARHDFISAKMEYIGQCHEQLARLVGEEEAGALMCQVIEQSGERHGQEKDEYHDDHLKGGIALDYPTSTDLFTRFQQRLSSVGGEAHQVAHLAEAAAIIAAHPTMSAGEIVVPPNFGQHPQWGALLPFLRRTGITIREAGSPANVADAPAGLSGAQLAIAETGSVLIAENALEARVVSMLTLAHFVLVSEDKLVPMLDDAAGILQQFSRAGSEQRHYMSFVTGPSRTADIERTLTIGVQGPKTLCVILVADKEEAKP